MADNFVANAGAGGKTFATDDVAGVDYPILKVALGALDAVTLLAGGAGAVSAGVPRVTLASDDPAVVALQVLDNAISGTEMQVDVVAALPAGNNNIGDVDVASIVPGTGATNLGKAIDSVGGATDTGVPALVIRDDALAALTPIEGDYVALRVDANGALWTHDDVLEAAISGSELQVDIVAALPAGANAIGKLAANTGVDIGDVDVTSVIAGTGATNLGKAEDAVHGTGDTGVYVLAVRDDSLAAHSGTDGDYESLHTDAAGALWVHHTADAITVASHAVTNAGTFAVQVDGSALTALQLIDNLVLAEDAVHATADPGVQALAVRKATPANLSGADGDYEPLQVSAGRLWASATIDAALPAGANAIGKLAANSGVDIGDVDVTSISAGTNLIGDVGIQGRTTGGLSFYKSIDLDETEEEVKATAGTLYSILAFNRTAAPLYLKFYNATAANVIVGTTVPDMTLVVPANADSDGAGFTHSVAQGYAFGTAISMAATTGVLDTDTGAPGANDCVVLVGYK